MTAKYTAWHTPPIRRDDIVTMFSRRHSMCAALTALALAFSPALLAGDWLTFGHDPQRTGWAFEETKITSENAAQLALSWKTISSSLLQAYRSVPSAVPSAAATDSAACSSSTPESLDFLTPRHHE